MVLHERTKRGQKGRLESGRDANIENHGNRFADIGKRERSGWDAGARMGRQWGSRESGNKRKDQCFP